MFLFYWIDYKCPIKSRMSNTQRPKIQPGGAATPSIRIPISNNGHRIAQHMMVQPGMTQHIMVQPGMAQHILVQPGMVQPGMAPHMMVRPGMAQHMMNQPGTGQYIIGPSHGFVVGHGFYTLEDLK